jgi:hypothetical protein
VEWSGPAGDIKHALNASTDQIAAAARISKPQKENPSEYIQQRPIRATGTPCPLFRARNRNRNARTCEWGRRTTREVAHLGWPSCAGTARRQARMRRRRARSAPGTRRTATARRGARGLVRTRRRTAARARGGRGRVAACRRQRRRGI